MSTTIPKTQYAVQLIGPDQLTLNRKKQMPELGPWQILGRVEAVGLCFSDLKLLKQYDKHARKEHIREGIEESILKEIPSYVPDNQPTVPGHETTVRIIAVGEKVSGVRIGARYLVETDYRWLPTTNSNASFGYNFEGGLQQYVLMDQRIITSPEGELFLLPASEELSASAVALVEPWACVEEAYRVKERSSLVEGGRMLIVADQAVPEPDFIAFLGRYGRPGEITMVTRKALITAGTIPIKETERIEDLPDGVYDDVLYFGSDVETTEKLFHKIGPNGLYNIIQCGNKFGRTVTSTIGRFHYGNIRMVGTFGIDPAESMEYIPYSGEIQANDKINVIGAGGPMGVMHVIRNICQGIPNITVFAGDLDDYRLGLLNRIAGPMAARLGVAYYPYHAKQEKPATRFDYTALMAPVPQLAAQAIEESEVGGIINIFAGIPAGVKGDLDLDAYIEKQLYFIGTSGSVLEDMKVVLKKVESGKLDTDISVAAISGMAGAVDGIRSVEKALIPGKILVYPACAEMGLIPLEKLSETMPDVAACLDNGLWNKKAEQVLLANYSG
ncbi:MAG: alcohol dehydrogenase catalytic domain-containing protein [Sedimentisphaerales bacterium]|nr:alcohol dehydrogenase catalytic domain-containing protein [Sedimentisphaerales bacterium]